MMTSNIWKKLITDRLMNFRREFEKVCISSGKNPEDVQIIYATKYLDSEQFEAFIHIAYEIDTVPIMIGENRVQNAEEKMEYIKMKSPKLLQLLKRIMIGTLQMNKINKAISLFDEIHSVDSLELAEALNQRLITFDQTGPAARISHPVLALRLSSCVAGWESLPRVTRFPIMPIFPEVNISGEETKHGFSPSDIPHILKSLKLLRSLKIEGLMTMAPFSDNPENSRPVFRKLKLLADKFGLKTSMGMSNDWKIAVEEGTDMIRVGSVLFKIPGI